MRITVGQAGNLLSANDYYAFGQIKNSRNLSSPKERFKYTGKEHDDETALDYFGARYYDGELGRWMSLDPMAAKYPGWSPYNYCVNNPFKFKDPDGNDIRYAIDNKNRRISLVIRANFVGKLDQARVNKWAGEIHKDYSMTIKKGKYDGYTVDTRLEATINAKARDKNYYQILYVNTDNPYSRSTTSIWAGKVYSENLMYLTERVNMMHKTGRRE